MITNIKKLYDWLKSEKKNAELFTPIESIANFELSYKKTIIGYLQHDNGKWIFKYSEEFKNQNELSLIIGFPNKNKVYESDILFPFFASRIPSIQRLKIQKIVPPNFIQNEINLLVLFGKQTITNPFYLTPI